MNITTEGILDHRIFAFEKYTRHFCCLNLDKAESWEEAMELYKEFIQFTIENEIQVVYEKVFGRIAIKDLFLDVREKHLRLVDLAPFPISHIEGLPLMNRDFSSIYIYGLSGVGDHFKLTYIPRDKTEEIIGTKVEMPGYRALYLNSLTLMNNEYKEDIDFDPVFNEITDLANTHGFLPTDIIRTWIYLSNIKRDYSNLNKARRKFFEKSNIDFGSHSPMLPASTCIEGATSDSSPIIIDTILIDRKTINAPRISRLYNDLQNEANGSSYLFGPTFSRALLLENDEYSEIQLSGTAGIDEAGKTVYLDDPFNQIKKAIQNINNLLQQHDFSFRDICQGTCFIKNEDYFNTYLKVLDSLGMESYVNTFAITNICREDLLFEIDGILIKTK